VKVAAMTATTHNPSEEPCWVSRLRENFTSGSYGEELETGPAARSGTAPVPYPTNHVRQSPKGFALEATHLTDPDKLCTLLALLAFAVALTVKTGVAMARLHPIPVKNHGRRARSLFALGLHTLRKIFVAASSAQIIAFLGQLLSPKLPAKPLLALAFR